MNIITEPKVHLLSFPSFIPHTKYVLPPHGHAAESLIAMGGKVCYDTYGHDGNPIEKHVKALVASGHHSVIEHVHVGLFIEGISRGCSHEIVRHRMFNYSQRSTRYTAEDDAAIVLDPFYADLFAKYPWTDPDRHDSPDVDSFPTGAFLLMSFFDGCRGALEEYRKQLMWLDELAPKNLNPRDKRKWCRGKARQLLPHALETRMVMTGNLRSWRHFLVMRSSRHAEAEIRRLACEVFSVVEPIAPSVFADLTMTHIDGYVELT